MPFTPTLIAALALLGLCTGFCAGLLGIGGGMLMVPFITLLLDTAGVAPALAVKVAIATSMSTIVFTSLSSVRAHHRRGAVRWDLVRGLAPGIVLGGLLSSLGAFAWIKGQALAIFFALFVGFSATQMLRQRPTQASRQMPGTAGQWGMGAGIGFLSGLVGAGGGFISVPLMSRCNVAIHSAVATSAALGFPIALANSLGYAFSGQNVPGLPSATLGYIWLPALAVLASASVLTAPWGARAAHRLPVARLKRIFAGLLYLLALFMLHKGLRG